MHEKFVKALEDEIFKCTMKSEVDFPFAAVIAKNSEIVAVGNDLTRSTGNAIATAEIVAVKNAQHVLQTKNLEGCVAYLLCEPTDSHLKILALANVDKIYHVLKRADLNATLAKLEPYKAIADSETEYKNVPIEFLSGRELLFQTALAGWSIMKGPRLAR